MNKYYLSAFFLIFAFFLVLSPCPSQALEKESGEDIRPPAVAGAFYPDSASQLENMLTQFLDRVPEIKPEGKVLAAVAPHAGYPFSGGVAAYTYRILSSVKFDTLIIIGHDTYQNAVAFICPVDYFQTPLGKVPVDREMISKMLAFNQGIKEDRSVHAHDHTIEVQLPFLQVIGRQCKIVPILFGNPTEENCRLLADAIFASTGNKRVFVLASTDMSHFPPYESACEVDHSTLDVLGTLDINTLFTHLIKQEARPSVPNLRTAMCARGGVGTAILVAKARGADRAQILRYANSGDVPAGDKYRVVGYCSVLMVKTTDHPSK